MSVFDVLTDQVAVFGSHPDMGFVISQILKKREKRQRKFIKGNTERDTKVGQLRLGRPRVH